MTNDVLVKIDTLIEMSKSKSNYDTIKAELNDIQDEIENKKREIEELKSSMQDDKYIKASDRIIDENIKVSLELKIQKLEINLKQAEKELKKKLKTENVSHQELKDEKEKAKRLMKLMDILKEKLSSLTEKDSSIQEYYLNLQKENEKKLNSTNTSITEKEETYQKISRELSEFTSELKALKDQIKDEKEKLTRTINNLESKESYIDKAKKEDDENRLNYLKTKLTELQERKDEILKDPVLIGNEAKELFIEDDRTSCLAKVKELITYIKTLPYMDIPNSMDVERILKEAEETAILERDEFASNIENKKYDGHNLNVLEERQNYLERQKQELEIQYEELKTRIEKIDTITIKEVNSLLSAAMVVQANLKKDLMEYDKVLNADKENSTPKKKATLTAAYKKKEEEITIIQEVIDSYEIEMENLMLESQNLEEKELNTLMDKIDKIDGLLKEIAKKTIISSKATDILALENDKTRLKELNNKINVIHERSKFTKTPSEIFDEIEMSLGSILESEELEEKQPEKDANDFRIVDFTEEIDTMNRTEKNKDILKQAKEDPLKENFEEKIDIDLESTSEEENSVLETMPPITSIEPTPLINPNILNPIEEPTVLTEVPEPILNEPKPMQTINKEEIKPLEDYPVTERWKVIHIENLEEEQKEVEEASLKDDVMISDFKDDDYIDFDSIIGG